MTLTQRNRWTYDSDRGWLTGKKYPDTGAGPTYGYSAAGRLTSRQWLRLVAGTSTKLLTTYKYDFNFTAAPLKANFGDLRQVTYNDGGLTPTVSYPDLDRRGRATKVTHGPGAATTTTLSYNNLGELLTEGHAGGDLNNLSVNLTYDAFARRMTMLAMNGATPLLNQNYGYQAGTSRLRQVDDGTQAARYDYEPNSPLVNTVTMGMVSGGSVIPRLTTVRDYDKWNRLMGVTATPSGSTMPAMGKRGYEYNAAQQRKRQTLEDGSYWAYDYDALGQVKAGNHHLKDGMPLAGQHFEYDYDALGNRTFSRSGGDISWYSLRQVSYAPAGSAAQNVNTYATRAVPRYLEVQGVAQSGATVTVSGVSPYAVSPPVTRQGEYFRAELAITANTAVSETVSVTPTGGSTRMGTLFLAPATETYVHDADGNLKQDGHWAYTWDAENRLTSVTSLAGPARIVNYRYDYAGRLV